MSHRIASPLNVVLPLVGLATLLSACGIPPNINPPDAAAAQLDLECQLEVTELQSDLDNARRRSWRAQSLQKRAQRVRGWVAVRTAVRQADGKQVDSVHHRERLRHAAWLEKRAARASRRAVVPDAVDATLSGRCGLFQEAANTDEVAGKVFNRSKAQGQNGKVAYTSTLTFPSFSGAPLSCIYLVRGGLEYDVAEAGTTAEHFFSPTGEVLFTKNSSHPGDSLGNPMTTSWADARAALATQRSVVCARPGKELRVRDVGGQFHTRSFRAWGPELPTVERPVRVEGPECTTGRAAHITAIGHASAEAVVGWVSEEASLTAGERRSAERQLLAMAQAGTLPVGVGVCPVSAGGQSEPSEALCKDLIDEVESVGPAFETAAAQVLLSQLGLVQSRACLPKLEPPKQPKPDIASSWIGEAQPEASTSLVCEPGAYLHGIQVNDSGVVGQCSDTEATTSGLLALTQAGKQRTPRYGVVGQKPYAASCPVGQAIHAVSWSRNFTPQALRVHCGKVTASERLSTNEEDTLGVSRNGGSKRGAGAKLSTCPGGSPAAGLEVSTGKDGEVKSIRLLCSDRPPVREGGVVEPPG